MDLNRFKIQPSQPVSLARRQTTYEEGSCTREDLLDRMEKNIEEFTELQQKLLSEEKEGLIFAFQAMDAAGKD